MAIKTERDLKNADIRNVIDFIKENSF